jgi:chemotaxis response regulator CheB
VIEAVEPDGGRTATAHRLRFLVADHSPVMRVLLRSLIEGKGMVVAGEATDGIAAITAALELRPDVVLLDVDLPRLSGLAAAELICWQRPRTRLFLHAEDPTGSTRRRARASRLPLVDRLDLPETILQLAEGRRHFPYFGDDGDAGTRAPDRAGNGRRRISERESAWGDAAAGLRLAGG